jgi:catechol 2,3-dioxygenase-like lactoylglutathione lyase family enzyme
MNWYIEQFSLAQGRTELRDDRRIVELSFSKTSFFLVEHEQVNRYTHIPFNFHTSKIREIHDDFTNKGITVTEFTGDENLICCDFYDPEGNRIGLVYEKNQGNPEHIEVGGTFLTVRNLNEAVNWYQEKLGYEFHHFEATGAAGVIGPTPAYNLDLTIYYAGVKKKSFQSKWSRIALVETPEFHPLVYKPYNILSSNIEEDRILLHTRGVDVTEIAGIAGQRRFSFYDIDRNQIEIVEK